MFQFLLAILSTTAGLLASLTMLVFLMAAMANASQTEIRQGKMMMLGVAAAQVAMLVLGIWLMAERKHLTAAIVGILPLVGVVTLFIVLLNIEW